MLSKKQSDVLGATLPRITILDGAISSGKTFIGNSKSVNHLVNNYNGDGLVFFIGKTLDTLERNVLLPLERQFGSNYFSYSKGAKKADLCGIPIELEGCNDMRAEAKIRGTTAEFIYGDELTLWNKSFLIRCMGSLRTPYARFLGTTNPDTPSNFVYTDFIERQHELDMLYIHFMMQDNPTLTEEYMKQVNLEYTGVFHDRFIKGLWVRAEGIIYRPFADNPTRYFFPHTINGEANKEFPRLMEVNAAFDPGGTQSNHAFVASGITPNYQQLIALRSERHKAEGTTPKDVDRMAVEFAGKVISKYGRLDYFYYDNEASVLGRGIKQAVESAYPQVSVRPCFKGLIRDRIDFMCRMLGLDRFKYTEDCETLKEALEQAVWDDKHEDTRLDNGSTPQDDIDALEYTFTNQMKRFIF